MKTLARRKKQTIILVMTKTLWTSLGVFCKAFCAVLLLAGCTVNPATGDQQFAALMSPQQEAQTGAQEHARVLKEFGVLPATDPVQVYVNKVGRKVAENTERADVAYKFFVLDSPTVNAFALPGGYIYVTRGILAQANSEAELAGVLAHEIAHITARHSAERYTHGVLTALGAAVIAAATDNAQAARAAGVGSELYIKSYSRGQESQADELGIRYLYKAGYDIGGMARFLENLGAQDDLQARMAGRNGGGFSYFSTHPRNEDRVAQAYNVAAQYPRNDALLGRDEYLDAIGGIVYGDSVNQGLVRGQSFYHPGMDFMFSVPAGFRIDNQPAQVTAVAQSGAVIIFDGAANAGRVDPVTYVSQVWMRGQLATEVERIEINGRNAATVSFPGRVNNRAVTIRLIAVAWGPDKFFRFQMAIPQGADATIIEDLKRTTYSLRPMTAQEKREVQPWTLRVIAAKADDTVESLAARTPFHDFREERFRVLNGMKPGDTVQPSRFYKVVVQ